MSFCAALSPCYFYSRYLSSRVGIFALLRSVSPPRSTLSTFLSVSRSRLFFALVAFAGRRPICARASCALIVNGVPLLPGLGQAAYCSSAFVSPEFMLFVITLSVSHRHFDAVHAFFRFRAYGSSQILLFFHAPSHCLRLACLFKLILRQAAGARLIPISRRPSAITSPRKQLGVWSFWLVPSLTTQHRGLENFSPPPRVRFALSFVPAIFCGCGSSFRSPIVFSFLPLELFGQEFFPPKFLSLLLWPCLAWVSYRLNSFPLYLTSIF
jgi:hypothetical protein